MVGTAQARGARASVPRDKIDMAIFLVLYE